MKTVIALWHSAKKGKTDTIRNLATLITRQYSFNPLFPMPFYIPVSGDFSAVVEVNNKIVAFESQGDPNTGLKSRLDKLRTKFNPEIIVCATRTKGVTVDDVISFSDANNYELIWTSTYQKDNLHDRLNRLKAKHLLDLLTNLRLI